jgi:hypothetical protein
MPKKTVEPSNGTLDSKFTSPPDAGWIIRCRLDATRWKQTTRTPNTRSQPFSLAPNQPQYYPGHERMSNWFLANRTRELLAKYVAGARSRFEILFLPIAR